MGKLNLIKTLVEEVKHTGIDAIGVALLALGVFDVLALIIYIAFVNLLVRYYLFELIDRLAKDSPDMCWREGSDKKPLHKRCGARS